MQTGSDTVLLDQTRFRQTLVHTVQTGSDTVQTYWIGHGSWVVETGSDTGLSGWKNFLHVTLPTATKPSRTAWVQGGWLEVGEEAAGDRRAWLRGRLRTAWVGSGWKWVPLGMSDLGCADGCGRQMRSRWRSASLPARTAADGPHKTGLANPDPRKSYVGIQNDRDLRKRVLSLGHISCETSFENGRWRNSSAVTVTKKGEHAPRMNTRP